MVKIQILLFEGAGIASAWKDMVRGFKSLIRLCADSSEPGACFRFCVSLSVSVPPRLTLCVSLSKTKIKKKFL